ncbi:MAG: hypothetical protein OQK24_04555 [Magnetovibrio sp.]|nr:hypothetical protein [Magnetovibrio sp.]
MTSGLAMAVASLRLFASNFIAAAILMALPVVLSSALVLASVGEFGLYHFSLELARAAMMVLFGAAFLRVLLNGQGLSLQTFQFGWNEFRFAIWSVILGLAFVAWRLVYFALMGLMMVFAVAGGLDINSEIFKTSINVGLVITFGYFVVRYLGVGPALIAGQPKIRQAADQAWRDSGANIKAHFVAAVVLIVPVTLLGLAGIELAKSVFADGVMVHTVGRSTLDYVLLAVVLCLSAVVFQSLAESKESR